MNTEQMPDFELPTPEGELPIPPRKKPRKPMKRVKINDHRLSRARRAVPVVPVPKKRRKAKRRGRPPGALNKPKVEAVASSSAKTIVSVYDRCNAILSELAPHERGPVLECLK